MPKRRGQQDPNRRPGESDAEYIARMVREAPPPSEEARRVIRAAADEYWRNVEAREESGQSGIERRRRRRDRRRGERRRFSLRIAFERRKGERREGDRRELE